MENYFTINLKHKFNKTFSFIFLFIGLFFSSGCGVDAVVTSVNPSQSLPEMTPPALPIQEPPQTSLKLIEYNETLNLTEGDKTVLILFSDKNAPQNLGINWQILGSGSDFLVTSGNTLLEAGKKSFSISLDTINDSLYSPNRNYILRITSSSQKIENSLDININVIENDPQYLIRFSTSSLSIKEGDPTLQIPILLNTAHTNPLNVEFLITGSGVSGTDYILSHTGIIQIPAGQTQALIDLTVPEDLIIENPKNLILTLYRTNQVGVAIDSPSQVTIQINDNDLAISPVSASVLIQDTLQLNANGGDGNYTYTILSPASSHVNTQGLLTTGNTAETLTIRIQDGTGLSADSHIQVIDPKSNPQLGLWLKADSLNLNNNEAVALWEDQTSYARNFNQNTASARPLFVTNQLNNKPVIRFDGVNDVLSSTYIPATSNNPRSLTTVLTNLAHKIDSTVYSWGSTNYWGDGFGLIAMTSSTYSYIGNTFGTYLHLSAATPYPSSNASIALQTPYIVTLQYDGTHLHFFVNGEPKGSTPQTVTTKTVNAMRIGSRFNTGFFQGDMAEILVHENIISSSERENIECYLSRKYNININTNLNCSHSELLLPYGGSLSLAVNQTHSIEVKGGNSPYRFSLLSGNSQIDSLTGVFTAGPTPGVNRIRVEDTWGQGAELNVHVTAFPRPLSWIDLSIQEDFIANQNVGFIKDKTGRNHNWLQRVTAHQPLFIENQLNSHPALQFSGNQFIAGSFSPPVSNAGRTFAFVLSDIQSGLVMDYGGSQNCGNRFAFKINSSTNSLEMDRQCTTNSTSPITLTDPQIILVKYTGTQILLRRNGTQALAVTTGITTSKDFSIRIGSNRVGSVDASYPYLTGKISEVIAFDSNLSNEEQAAVETYLSNKFNIPLP